MSIRTQLLAAFVGVVLLALGIFGTVAYWLLPDAAKNADTLLLQQFGREIGDRLSRPVASGALNDAMLTALRRRLTGSDTIVLVEDKQGRLVAVSAAGDARVKQDTDRLLKATRTASSRAVRNHGVLDVGNARYSWATSPITGTPYSVTVAHPFTEEYEQFSSTLWVRLVATGLFVMWVAVWAALVIASVIARRLNEKNAALTYQAHHDGLTGLPNRTLLHRHLQSLIRSASQHGESIALFVMDLDRFKDVNDTLGHPFGDQLLQLVGQRVSASLRADDIMARLGGDEFAVALPATGRKQAVTCAMRILHALEQPFVVEGLTLDVKTSIGIAVYPEHGEAPDRMVQHADTAMYKAKKAGVGYRFYDPDEDPHSLRRLTLTGELRRGIEHNQLVLYYQPKVDLKTHRAMGVEALVRWHHPQHGLVPPDEFIPLAERTGLIRPLTEWVLNEAVRQSSVWRRRGLYLSVAVNLSAYNLKHPLLPTEIGALLQTWDVPASALVLELTESAMMEDPELATDIVRRMDSMGLRIAVDDFGTGYSSLAHLQRLSVHELKIDKSFVIGMDADDSNVVIVRSIVDLAHNLGCRVVAEGVENSDGLRALEALGCDGAQGYYLSRPLPASALESWLAQTGWGRAFTSPVRAVGPPSP
ncbi:MAG TPA: EAL domain-containing protein [Gammaproteobacteria bacterium]|nr:EAL domain-containing protein [Gammaproteobacteria bacterium]